MILTTEQIKNILLNNPNRELVNKGIKYNKAMRLHLYGDGLKESMERIDGFETAALSDLRVKYARSNKDVFSRLKRPIDKAFSARGGSIYYNLPEAQDKLARRLASDVAGGYSIRKWVEMFWTPHMLDDPFGLVFLEMMPEDQARIAQIRTKSTVYPTYKAITSIYDYAPNGSTVDYVVFNVTVREKVEAGYREGDVIFRVVDDAYDYWVMVEGAEKNIRVLPQSYKNWFGRVPALLNSAIPDSQNEGCVVSFFDDVIELAKHYLMKGAIKLTHEFLHAYPKYWQYAEGCNSCSGTGYDAKRDDHKCQDCMGTGKKVHLKVSDAMLLDFPTGSDQKVTPDIAGYISPDKTYYEIATSDLKMYEEVMFATLWGYQPKVPGGNQSVTQLQEKTATEVLNETKPQADRLQVISEMAEKIHKFILDGVVVMNITWNYGGSSVNYGRRYMVEGPDEIWRKYSEARTSGAPVSVLEDLLIEYYEAKYASDRVALEVALKLMYVEPFVHHSVDEVRTFMPSDDQWKAKLYFSEWLSEQSETAILLTDIKALKESLKTYATALQAVSLEPPEPKQIAA